MQISNALAEFYLDLFANRRDAYNKQVLLNGKCGYPKVEQPLTVELIQQHLQGDITLGFSAIDLKNMSKFGVWDEDADDGKLDRIQEILRRIPGLYPLREGRRVGRAGHLWLFLDKALPAADLRRFEREIRAHTSLAENDLEFFPKQDEVSDNANPIRGPLGIHRKPGANKERGWFEGPPRAIEAQLIWLAEQPLSSAQAIIDIVDDLRVHDKYVFKPIRRRSSTVEELEEIFAELEPEWRGSYYVCLCPHCEEREAFFYEQGNMLICNRRKNCKFRISVSEFIRAKKYLPVFDSRPN